MQRDCLHAGVLTAKSDRDGIAHLLVPAAANLAGDREMCGTRDGANDLLYEPEIPEAPRPAIAFHHFLDRAAEVDVDELGLKHIGHERGSLAHRAWFAA